MSETRRRNILILAEGNEEKPYIDKILSFPNINKEVYNFAEAINVKGNGKIFARYQYEFQKGYYDLILVFCDGDNNSSQFLSFLNSFGEYFFKNKKDSLEVFIYSNPVTLQIILSHFGEVKLKNVGKKTNAKIVEQLTGIKNYSAKNEQIDQLINKINYNSLDLFKNNLSKISSNIKDIPSTNFLMFLNKFESSDSSWINEILKKFK
ncbi:MAG: hypothetical protein IJ656_01545 [Bacilli bacterium]|nr:hypothetical protein [Bacilli bacterium]